LASFAYSVFDLALLSCFCYLFYFTFEVFPLLSVCSPFVYRESFSSYLLPPFVLFFGSDPFIVSLEMDLGLGFDSVS